MKNLIIKNAKNLHLKTFEFVVFHVPTILRIIYN